MTLTFGSCFAGLGGIDLALERVSMACAWQIELDDDCNRVLAHHWPSAPKPDDWLDLNPPLSNSTKYRLIGNSVAVPVIEWIGRRIIEFARQGVTEP